MIFEKKYNTLRNEGSDKSLTSTIDFSQNFQQLVAKFEKINQKNDHMKSIEGSSYLDGSHLT